MMRAEAKNRFKTTANELAIEHLKETEALHAEIARLKALIYIRWEDGKRLGVLETEERFRCDFDRLHQDSLDLKWILANGRELHTERSMLNLAHPNAGSYLRGQRKLAELSGGL